MSWLGVVTVCIISQTPYGSDSLQTIRSTVLFKCETRIPISLKRFLNSTVYSYIAEVCVTFDKREVSSFRRIWLANRWSYVILSGRRWTLPLSWHTMVRIWLREQFVALTSHNQLKSGIITIPYLVTIINYSVFCFRALVYYEQVIWIN